VITVQFEVGITGSRGAGAALTISVFQSELATRQPGASQPGQYPKAFERRADNDATLLVTHNTVTAAKELTRLAHIVRSGP